MRAQLLAFNLILLILQQAEKDGEKNWSAYTQKKYIVH